MIKKYIWTQLVQRGENVESNKTTERYVNIIISLPAREESKNYKYIHNSWQGITRLVGRRRPQQNEEPDELACLRSQTGRTHIAPVL